MMNNMLFTRNGVGVMFMLEDSKLCYIAHALYMFSLSYNIWLSVCVVLGLLTGCDWTIRCILLHLHLTRIPCFPVMIIATTSLIVSLLLVLTG